MPPHKDCWFVFVSPLVTFNWILDFEAQMAPQSSTAFVCLEEIFVDLEFVKSIIYSATYRRTSKILMHIFNLILGLVFLSLNRHFNKLLFSLVLTYVSPDLALGWSLAAFIDAIIYSSSGF